ncbi:MAG TPA: DUF3592 domain-containing protein [Anaerolineales bacterium]|nr:DUF3592 domain-containing protein [Anaerolineales bacterium]
MTQTSKEILDQAVYLLRAGNRAEAVSLLAGLLRSEPDHEMGWFLLGAALEKPKDQIRAFEEVLKINPLNQKAKQRLAELRSQTESLPHIDPYSTGSKPSRPSPPRRTMETESQFSTTPARKAPHSRTAAEPQAVQPAARARRTHTAQKPGAVQGRSSAVPRHKTTSTQRSAPARARGAAKSKKKPKHTLESDLAILEHMWKSVLDMRVRIFGIGILVIGLVLAGMLINSLWKDIPLWIFGRTTNATITAKYWGDFDITNPDLANNDLANLVSLNMQYFFEYEFTMPTGETYLGKSEVTEQEFIGYGEGSAISVRYSILDPANSRIDDSRFVPFLICTYSVFLIITLFTLAAGREMIDF